MKIVTSLSQHVIDRKKPLPTPLKVVWNRNTDTTKKRYKKQKTNLFGLIEILNLIEILPKNLALNLVLTLGF